VLIVYPIVYVLLGVLAFLLLAYAPAPLPGEGDPRGAGPARARLGVRQRPGALPHFFPYVADCVHAGGPERGPGQRRRVVLDRRGTPASARRRRRAGRRTASSS